MKNCTLRSRILPAFTLPELLVCMGVIAVIVSMVIPGVVASRRRAIELRCLNNVRQMGTLVALYTQSGKDLFPAYASEWRGSVEEVDVRSLWFNQPRQVWRFEPWVSFVGYDPTQKDDFYRCADHTTRTDPSFARYKSDVRIPLSLYLRPGALSPDPVLRARYRYREAQVQKLSDAAFPSKKVGVVEYLVWHSFRGKVTDGSDATSLFMYATLGNFATSLLDGSGKLPRRTEINPAQADIPDMVNGIISATPDGILGRDLLD